MPVQGRWQTLFCWKGKLLPCSILSPRNVHRNQKKNIMAILFAFACIKPWDILSEWHFCKANRFKKKKTRERKNVANFKILISFSERMYLEVMYCNAWISKWGIQISLVRGRQPYKYSTSEKTEKAHVDTKEGDCSNSVSLEGKEQVFCVLKYFYV